MTQTTQMVQTNQITHFNGIFNDGYEQKMNLTIHGRDFEYQINDKEGVGNITSNKIVIFDTEYNCTMEQHDNEIILIGKENPSILCLIFNCFYYPKFFVLTNIQTV